MKATCELNLTFESDPEGHTLCISGEISIPALLPDDFLIFIEGDTSSMEYIVSNSYMNANNGVWKPHIYLQDEEVPEGTWNREKWMISQLFLPGYIFTWSEDIGEKPIDWLPAQLEKAFA